MTDDRPDAAKRLVQAREARGFKTAKDAAVYFGWNVTSYQQHEGGQRGIGRQAGKYAEGLRVSEGWLLTGEGQGPDGSTVVRPVIERQTAEIIPGRGLVTNDRSLPIFPAAMGGDGHVIITFDPIEYVKRPTVLEHVKDGYGVYIAGDSMSPAYRPGDTALVHPRLPPQRDTDVVLFHTPPHQEAECIIKHLVGFSDREWRLEQYNPAKEFDEFRKEWPVCHRVVGKYNRR